MSNIKYNEKEKAFELPYNLWDNTITVRFYAANESEIMEKLSKIAEKLAKLDDSKKGIVKLIVDERYYGGAAEALEKSIHLKNVHIDIDDDDVVVCFDVTSDDGYLPYDLYIELIDYGFEIAGIAEDLVQ